MAVWSEPVFTVRAPAVDGVKQPPVLHKHLAAALAGRGANCVPLFETGQRAIDLQVALGALVPPAIGEFDGHLRIENVTTH